MNIVLKGVDGSVAIMYLTPGADKEETVKKFKDSHDKGFYVDYFEFDGKLPLSREFRSAWALSGNKIVVDKAKASTIHMERIRHVRDEELIKLDGEQLRYLTDVAKVKELEEKKQVLRNLPVNVKGLEWPELLGERK